MSAAVSLWAYPRCVRGITAKFLPVVKASKWYADAVKQLMEPIYTERCRAMQHPDFERPKDIIQWAIDNIEGVDPMYAARLMLRKVAAAHINTVQLVRFSVLLLNPYTLKLRQVTYLLD
jgi:hypothetical protein